MQEAQDMQTEINEALGQSVVDFDEDELMDELNELEVLKKDAIHFSPKVAQRIMANMARI